MSNFYYQNIAYFLPVMVGRRVHEFALVQEMLALLEPVALEHRFTKITRITLRLGVLANVVPEALEMAFQALVQGTRYEGAVLQWETVPVLAECQACGQQYTATGLPLTCPRCQGVQARILDGTQVSVVSLEGEGYE